PHHLQNDLHRVPPTHPDDRRRRFLGQPCLGLLLELGSQRNVGGDYVAGLRGISPHAHHPRVARTPRGLFCHPGICCSDVHLFWSDVPVAWAARVCLTLRNSV